MTPFKKNMIKYYLSLFQYKWGLLSSCIIASILQSLTLVTITWLVKQIFDDAIPQEDFSSLIKVSIFIILLYLLNGTLALGIRYFILKVSQSVSFLLKNRLVAKLLHLDKRALEENEPAVLHTIILQDTERLDVMTNALIAQLLPSVIISITICVGLLFINALFFFMTIMIIPLIVLLSKWLSKYVRKSTVEMHTSFESMSNSLYKIITFWDQIYLFGKRKKSYNAQSAIHKKYSEERLKGVWMQTAFTVMQDTLLAVGGIVMIIFGGYYVINKEMTWGELFSFYVALALLKTYIYRIATNIPQVLEGYESLQKLYQFSQSREERYLGTKKIDFRGNLSLKNVSFAYAEKTLLEQLSLEIKAGQCVILQGENGVGKSTLIKLLLGLYHPSEGKVCAEGVDYHDIDLRSVLDKTGIVLQQPKMRDGSIRDNISENHTLEEIIWASKIAKAHDIILGRGGYEKEIKGNENLSGGEIQRLAIARALVKKPSLLILDEPFNHLDIEIASSILGQIKAMPHNPTIILISHQKWVIPKGDQVYRLEKGSFAKS